MFSTLNKMINRFSINNILRQLSPKLRHFSSMNKRDLAIEREIDNLYQNERSFDELSVDMFKELIIDKTIEDKISMILSEYEFEKYTTLRVPTTLTTDQMKDLLTCRDSEDRKKWLLYLFKRQNGKNNTKNSQKKRSEEYWKQKQEFYSQRNNDKTGIWDNNQQLIYGLWHNTLFSKILRPSVKRYYSHRLRRAALFGPKLVIDLDYDKYMSLPECRLLAKQIFFLYNWNRYDSEEPFDLHFTNCDPNTQTLQTIKKSLLNHNSPHFLADFHQKSYTHLFPKERLIYLSPHSEQSLKKFDSDDIYIISGLIGKSFRTPITYIKAKKEGIRCAKLPTDDHIVWNEGSNSLCLTHTMEILHDVYLTGDIGKALKDRIPKRKQKTVQQIEYEDMIRKQRLNRLKKSKHYF